MNKKIDLQRKLGPKISRLLLEVTAFRDNIINGMPKLEKEIGRGQYGVVYSTKNRWAGTRLLFYEVYEALLVILETIWRLQLRLWSQTTTLNGVIYHKNTSTCITGLIIIQTLSKFLVYWLTKSKFFYHNKFLFLQAMDPVMDCAQAYCLFWKDANPIFIPLWN